MYKQLYRSRKNRVLSGVFGGLGTYLRVDPVIVRLLGLLVILATGLVPGVIVYIVAMVIVPEEPDVEVRDVS